MKQRVLRGFTFRRPDGTLDSRITDTISWAQSNAAFDLPFAGTGRTFPDDWNRAYALGYRIVRAKLVGGATEPTAKEYQHD